MEFAMLIMKSRKKKQLTERIELSNQEKIRSLGEKETYKYLGRLRSGLHQTSEDERKKFKNGYLRKMLKLFEIELYNRNLVKGINTWAVTLLRCCIAT